MTDEMFQHRICSLGNGRICEECSRLRIKYPNDDDRSWVSSPPCRLLLSLIVPLLFQDFNPSPTDSANTRDLHGDLFRREGFSSPRIPLCFDADPGQMNRMIRIF